MTFSTRPFRARLASALLALLGTLLAQALLYAQKNPVTDAPMRLRIEKIARTDWPAKVGVVDIAPCLGSSSRFGVFDAEGKPMAFQTLWSAQGEETRLCFDTSSGAESCFICFNTDLPMAGGSWAPEAGVLLETRPCRADLPINTAPQIARLLSAAGAPSGCDYVPNIFLGANPFGPSTYYVATFNGWFEVPKAAPYTFATASDDASYLEVDNRAVATWLGVHGAGGGTHGEHSGTIALSAGLHRLSYVQIQLNGASAAVAGWKPPGRQHIELMPPSAFVPVARFHVTGFKCASPGAGRIYFDWHTVDQCALGGAMFVRVQFRVVDDSRGRSYRWRFDDGSVDTGVNPRHFFPQPGLRQVTLEVLQGGVVVATNSLRLRINPDWQQRDWWREDIFNEAKNDFLRRDLALMPAHDLISVLDLADRSDDRELLTRLGEILIKRQEEFNAPAYAGTFYKMGMVLEHQGDWGDALAVKSFRLALAPQRDTPAISEQARLRLAALLIHFSSELDEAGKLLGSISSALPGAEERRLWQLLRGDLSLARRRKDEARKEYAALGNKETPGIARAARLESAAILLQNGQWDDAQEALDRLQSERPLERMSLDAGLLALDLELARKEFQRALTDGHTLLTVAGDDPREAEVLYAVVQSGLALGKEQEAQRALGRMLKDFPYSEAAAKAKDRWSKK
jgi:tetratricopeptide (TPR) repeat protein